MKASAKAPTSDGKAPHLMCARGDIADVVLLPGDPGRVKLFERLCGDFSVTASNREYTVGRGTYDGVPVSVCSTGIGAPSTEIAVVELIELGAKALIRIGGTGVMRPDIACGEMVINTAAVRKGGSSCFYAPPEYPAVASFEVVQCLIDACALTKAKYHTGISASVGSFFAGQGRLGAGRDFSERDWCDYYARLGVLNMEMESETIFTLASLYGVLSGSICAVHANRATDEWMSDFEGAQLEMCRTALEAVALLTRRYLAEQAR